VAKNSFSASISASLRLCVTFVSMSQLPPITLAVLISGSGTTLQNLIDQIAAGRLDARINLVVASRDGVGGIERARRANLNCIVVDRARFTDDAVFSERVFHECEEAKADLVCLAGWLRLLKIPPTSLFS